jgi:hypothetical protein
MAGERDYLLPIDATSLDIKGTGIPAEHIIEQLTDTRCKNVVVRPCTRRMTASSFSRHASFGSP